MNATETPAVHRPDLRTAADAPGLSTATRPAPADRSGDTMNTAMTRQAQQAKLTQLADGAAGHAGIVPTSTVLEWLNDDMTRAGVQLLDSVAAIGAHHTAGDLDPTASVRSPTARCRSGGAWSG